MSEQDQIRMKYTVVVVSFTNIASDVRIVRHLSYLTQTYDVITIGFGPSPVGVLEHHQIPAHAKYLPLTFSGIIGLVSRRYEKAIKATGAISFVSDLLENMESSIIILNDVQTIALQNNLDADWIRIIDMHEYAPLEMEDDWRFRLLLQNYYTYLCARYLSKANAVITVSEGLATEYSARFGIDVDVVRNAREYIDQEVNSDDDVILRLVHTGLAARGRHLEKMIHAVGDLPGVSLSLYLVQAPRQKRTLSKLRKACALYSNCEIHPPVPSSQLPATIAKYDAGLLYIYPSNFSLKHSLPNKLFDCIQARRPVIVGPAPDLANFVTQFDVGYVAKSFNVDDMRAFIKGLNKNKMAEKRESLNQAALLVNAKTECEKLLSVIAMEARLFFNNK